MVVRSYLKQFYDELQGHEAAVREMETIEPIRDVLLALYKGIINRIAISGEITDDYMRLVGNPASHITKELMTQRLKNVYRDLLFVGAVSTIEFNFIRLTTMCPKLDPLGKAKGEGAERKIHLRDIIGWNKDKLDDFHLWDFAIKLRNDIVHFDARGRQSMDSPKIEFPIVMKEGQEAQGYLRSFISLTRALENSFFKIIPNIL